MELNPLAPIYIARSKPKCFDCGERATWRLMMDEDDPTAFKEFCAAHAPVVPHDITGE
jgi:hypothetical protein